MRLNRRLFLGTALCGVATAALPLRGVAAFVPEPVGWIGGVATSSFAWGESPDAMIDALMVKMAAEDAEKRAAKRAGKT